jgi:hypothetical protein
VPGYVFSVVSLITCASICTNCKPDRAEREAQDTTQRKEVKKQNKGALTSPLLFWGCGLNQKRGFNASLGQAGEYGQNAGISI